MDWPLVIAFVVTGLIEVGVILLVAKVFKKWTGK